VYQLHNTGKDCEPRTVEGGERWITRQQEKVFGGRAVFYNLSSAQTPGARRRRTT